jgi:hypothetical protein
MTTGCHGIDFSLTKRFDVININPEESSVVIECLVGCGDGAYKIHVKLIKDASNKLLGYRDELQNETADFLKLKELVNPIELAKAQRFVISQALSMYDQIDSMINKVKAERNCNKALEALPAPTEKRKVIAL